MCGSLNQLGVRFEPADLDHGCSGPSSHYAPATLEAISEYCSHNRHYLRFVEPV